MPLFFSKLKVLILHLMPDKSAVSHGSTTIEDLVGTADAIGTIALNRYEGGKAA